MMEKIQDGDRRKFILGASAVGAMAVAPLLKSVDVIAQPRLDKYSVHEAKGQWVSVELLRELKVPYPDNWQDLLGGEDTGIVVSKKWHRMWVFKDGQLKDTQIVSSGAEYRNNNYKTLEGLRHIGGKENLHYSQKYNNAPMPSTMWLEDGASRRNGDALHGSGNFITGKDGKVQVHLDFSHGCVNIYKPIAKKLFDTQPIGTPVYILSESEEWHPEGRPTIEDLDKELLTQTKLAEQTIRDSNNLNTHSMVEVRDLLVDIIPQIPLYDDIEEEVAHKIYSNREHYTHNDPVIRLKSKKNNALHGNAIRIGAERLLTVIGGVGRVLNNKPTKDALRIGKHKNLIIENLTALSDGDLHGTWATAFGYVYNDGWMPVRAAGLLLDTDNGFDFVTKDSDTLEQGMPIYARVNGTFEFVGVASGVNSKQGSVYIHKLIGPTKLKIIIE